ncbi:MAG: DUF3634 family protein [Verrucomicrobiales bacterium]
MKFFSRMFSEYAIQIHGASASCVKGKIAGSVLRDIHSIASANGVLEGEIWIDKIGRVTFSNEIPSAIHQRLRNAVAPR